MKEICLSIALDADTGQSLCTNGNWDRERLSVLKATGKGQIEQNRVKYAQKHKKKTVKNKQNVI
ncbi:hypothetical protein [Suipraeoptans intestinalis]|uniref:hypothetical protein n=1 Tax=Suipraeoptans intestinalis TaxID=2606628 RepID=UPI0023F36F62|nr:hypothetical protein [Suipraeoptans intestinalis]MDD7771111.1 hypothetical protein [Suipraeoptans intestinalis]MDY3121552.1 hypothetical protein [Suipraeoptans intestinalis]